MESPCSVCSDYDKWEAQDTDEEEWLDKRALVAMQGILSNVEHFDFSKYLGSTYYEAVSECSYEYAEAMLAEKKKRMKKGDTV
jgi:hypothetical protein